MTRNAATQASEIKLTETVDYLRRLHGPLVIVGKGHSGTRFLAGICKTRGVFIGRDLNMANDSLSWHEDFAVPLMTSRWYPDWPPDDPEFRRWTDDLLRKTLARYFSGPPPVGPWGWKGSTLFVTEVLLRYFPEIRLVHIIRDGRDVVTSDNGTLNLPYNYQLLARNPFRMMRSGYNALAKHREFNDYRLKVFFNRSDIAEWKGIRLNRREVFANRYLFQMQSWVNNVRTARAIGQRLGSAYYELRYEDLCERPAQEITALLEWCGLDPDERTLDYAVGHASQGSIGKWRRGCELAEDRRRDFLQACKHGQALLDELGYDRS